MADMRILVGTGASLPALVDAIGQVEPTAFFDVEAPEDPFEGFDLEAFVAGVDEDLPERVAALFGVEVITLDEAEARDMA